MPSPSKISDYLERHSSRLFWWLFAAQVIGWTLIPVLTQHNAPMDVIEGFAWGREWPLGTPRHPPLQAWMLEIAYQIFGTCSVGYFGLSALCTGVALWAIYRTGRLIAGKREGLISAFLAQSILYFTFLSPEFNPNVLQLVMYALAGYAFTHALIRNKNKYWALFGAFMALGMYGKYSMAVLGVVCLLFLLYYREGRQKFLTPGPYLALAVGILLFAPNALWVAQHQFSAFAFPLTRSEVADNLLVRVLFPVKFALAQLVDFLPALLCAAILFLPLQRKPASRDVIKNKLPQWLAFGPLVLAVSLSFISGQKLRDMWGMGFLDFVPLWLVTRYTLKPARLQTFGWVWGGLYVIALAAFAINLLFAPQLGFKPLRGHFPGRELAAETYRLWEKKTKKPLQYVVGDTWYAGTVLFYGPAKGDQRPHMMTNGSPALNPWIDLQKLKESGAMFLWKKDSPESPPPEWLKDFPKAKTGKDFELKWNTPVPLAPIRMGWAWQPPA